MRGFWFYINFPRYRKKYFGLDFIFYSRLNLVSLECYSFIKVYSLSIKYNP